MQKESRQRSLIEVAHCISWCGLWQRGRGEEEEEQGLHLRNRSLERGPGRPG